MNRRNFNQSIVPMLAANLLMSPESATAAPFSLPKLPYALDALEPYVDAKTMEIHHDKHHQAYIDNLTKTIQTDPKLTMLTAEELLSRLDTLPETIRTTVRNNAGGHLNHQLFWQTLAKPSKQVPKGKLASAIAKTFEGQGIFENKLKETSMKVFGSGWVWLSLDRQNYLRIEPYPNQDNPLLRGQRPLLGIDVWEHAYYLKYQNRRPEYLTAILNVINWDFVSSRYEELIK